MSKLKVFGVLMSLVKTRDRWYNIGYYIRNVPAWVIYGRAAMSIPQQKATDAFAEIQGELNDAGLDRWQRRLSTASILRGVSYGGAPRKPSRVAAPEATVKSAIAKAEAIVARYK